MAALWISNSTVTDPESYAQYGKLVGPVIAAHGGRFIARSAPYTQLEGHEHPRHVVIRFPSLEEAVACYTSEGYHAAHAPAAGAAQRDVCIVECEDDPLDQPGALWIAHVTVTDEEAYGKYAALAGPAIAAHDGRFIARAGRYQHEVERYLSLAAGQQPHTMIIGCADSRVDPATIFAAGPGELFVVRNVAALAPPYEESIGYHGTSAALEFAVDGLGVAQIVVMGHSFCGGVQAALAAAEDRPVGRFIRPWVELLSEKRDALLADPGMTLVLEPAEPVRGPGGKVRAVLGLGA